MSLGSAPQRSWSSTPPTAHCQVDLKLTHLDWSPEATLIHFQGMYLTLCEKEYKCLHEEIQRSEKTRTVVDIGEFCLVEDVTSALWFRGRVQNRTEDLFDVFLIDHGNILSVDSTHISSCTNDIFNLPPKITCGFLANVLMLQSCPHVVMKEYLSSLVLRNITGYIEATLSDQVLLLEVPDINSDLVKHGFGRHLDTDTFLFLVKLLTEVPIKRNAHPCPKLAIEKPVEQELTFQASSWRGYKDLLPFLGPKLSCGTRTKMRVSAALSAKCFYCQIVNKEAVLLDMSKKLNMIVCRNAGHSLTTEKISLLCSVKGKDGNWYRGFLPFLPVGSQMRVFLVDYGFFETVKIKDIHRLPPDFLSTPFMAFPCLLSSLTGQDEVHRAQQLRFLKQGLLGDILNVEINSFDEVQHLFFVTLNGVEGDQTKESEHAQQFATAIVEAASETEKSSPCSGHLCHKLDIANMLNQTLKAEALNIGSTFFGYVEYAMDPNNFWVRTQKRNKEFDEMMKEIADHFSQVRVNEDVLINPELGTLCCAMYEKDMHFYRAVVTEILEQGVEVLFIDFGNMERVPYMFLKNIPEAIASKSAFSFCCTLANLIAYDVWTTKMSSFFRKAVLNKLLMVQIVEMKNSKIGVELSEFKGLKRQSVTELLLKFDRTECLLLKSDLRKRRKGGQRKMCSQPHLTQHVWATEQSQNFDDEDGAEYINTVQETLSFRTDNLLNQGVTRTTLSKQQSVKFPETFVYSSYDLNPGCEEEVHITYVNSQWEVYCHLDKNTEIINDLEQKISDKSKKMMEDKTKAVMKELCLAKYFDGTWYRALVHATPSPSHLRVFYVDYGNATISEKSALIFIPRDCADLLHIPMQAMRFCLDSVPKEELIVDVKEWLDDAILNKQLRAVICRNNMDGSFDVKLFDGRVCINEEVKKRSQSLSSQPKAVDDPDMLTPNRKTDKTLLSSPKLNSNKENKRKIYQRKKKVENGYGTAAKNLTSVRTQRNVNKVQEESQAVESKPTQQSMQAQDNEERRRSVEAQDEDIKLDKQDGEDVLNTKYGEDVQPGKDTLDSKDMLDAQEGKYTQDGEDVLDAEDGGVVLDVQVGEDMLDVQDGEDVRDEQHGKDVLSGKNALDAQEGKYVQDGEDMLDIKDGKDMRDSEDALDVQAGEDTLGVQGVEDMLDAQDGGDVLDVKHGEDMLDVKDGKDMLDVQDGEDVLDVKDGEDMLDVKDGKDMLDVQDGEDVLDAKDSKDMLDVKDGEDMLDVKDGEDMLDVKDGKNMLDVQDGEDVLDVQDGEDVLDVKDGEDMLDVKDGKDMLDVQDGEDVLDAKDSKDMLDVQDGEDVLDVKDGEDMLDVKDGEDMLDVKDGKDMLDVQDGEDMLDVQDGEDVLDVKDGEDVLDVKDGKDMLDVKDGKDMLDVQDGEDVLDAQDGKDIRDSEDAPDAQDGEDVLDIQESEDVLDIQAFEDALDIQAFEDALDIQTFEDVLDIQAFEDVLDIQDSEDTQDGKDIDSEERQVAVEAGDGEEAQGIPSAAEMENEDGEEPWRSLEVVPQRLLFAPVKADKPYLVFAVSVTSPFEFSVVLDEWLFVVNQVSTMLKDLTEPTSPLPEARLVPGTCCLLKSESTERWYRAEIVDADVTLVLNLVDHGQYERLPRSDRWRLKTLPAQMRNLPKGTYPCVLKGVNPAGADGRWTDEGVAFFHQCLFQKPLQLFFREFVSSSHWKVDILTDGVDVAKQLVDAGHAEYTHALLQLRCYHQSAWKALIPYSDSEEDEDEHHFEETTDEPPDDCDGAELDSAKANPCLLM